MPCTNLTSLPTEIIVAIYERLTIKEIIQTRQTCKLLAEISNEPSIWKALSDHCTESTNEDIAKIAEDLPPSELQTLILRRVSSDYGWKRRAEPVARNATRDMGILDGGKLLLPGGRWLFTWGVRFEPGMPYAPQTVVRTILAYDLDSGPQITGPRTIFKSSKVNEISFEIRFVAAQVSYSDDGKAGFIVAVASNKLGNIMTGPGLWGSELFLEIFHFTFDGQASPPIRVLELRSGPLDRLDLRDDFVLLEHGSTYEILNWRTANGPSWNRVFLKISVLARARQRAVLSRLLPGGRLLRICPFRSGAFELQIFLSELEGKSSETNPGDDRLPIWNLPIVDGDFVIEPHYTNFSEPLHIQGETRIAMRVQSMIYGLIFPDTIHEKPRIFELARFEQKYLHNIRHRSITMGIDKLVAVGGYGTVRFLPFTAAFSWPSAKERPSWHAPFIVPIVRDLEAYRITSVGILRCSIVIDPVFGRVVTGAKSMSEDEDLSSDEDWDQAVAWSVVDFAAPHLLT